MMSPLLAMLRPAMASLKALFEMPSVSQQPPAGNSPAVRPGPIPPIPCTRPPVPCRHYPGAPYAQAERLPGQLQKAFSEEGAFQFLLYEFCCIFIIDTSPNILLHDVHPSRWDAARNIVSGYLARMIKKNVAVRAAITCTSMVSEPVCPLTPVRDQQAFISAMKTTPPANGNLWPNCLGYVCHAKHATTRVVVLSDGFTQNRQMLLDTIPQYPRVHHFDCIGLAGSPAQVDEEVLRTMASPGRDGQPRYRWIGQADELIHTFAGLDLEDYR